MEIAYAHTYRIKVFASYAGQLQINKFDLNCYSVAQANEDGEDILDDWWSDAGEYKDMLPDAVQFEKLQITHLGSEDGTQEIQTTETGTWDDTGILLAPSFVVASFRLYTVEGITRSGWKRLGPISGGHCLNNIYDPSNNPDLSTEVTAFRNFMVTDYTSPAGNVFRNVIVRGTPPTYIPVAITSCAVPKLGSQISRKTNVGD